MKIKLTFLLITILSISSYSQCNSELSQYAVGFDGVEQESFSFLDKELDGIQIMGFGEDTHGTAEFTTMAGNLMQYLSKKQGFKIFVLETGFGEGQYLNDYIQGKSSDLKYIMNERNKTWRYQTIEFYQIMKQLKEYNQNNADKIFIYGCEMQYVISDINRIKDYLEQVGSDYEIEGFEKFNIWQNFEESEKTDYYISYANLKKYFLDNYEIFKDKTSEKEINLTYHLVEVLGQFISVINQNAYQRKHDFREIYMLENIEWILNYEGEDSKLLYWAHNEHIGDMTLNGTANSIGRLLKNGFGNSYFAIGTDFGIGNFLAYPADANETGNWYIQTYTIEEVTANTFTECLKNMGSPNTYLNIRKARANDILRLFLDNPLTLMSGAGAQIRPYKTEMRKIGQIYDAIIYLDVTHEIKWKN